MADSIQKDQYGPDWPLGLIPVAAASTPVGIMSLVDPSSVDGPSASGVGGREFTVMPVDIIFTPCKKNAGTGVVANTGNIYIMRQAVGAGSGNRTDYGSMVAVIRPTDPPFRLAVNGGANPKFNPYRYFLDADNNADGAVVTLILE